MMRDDTWGSTLLPSAEGSRAAAALADLLATLERARGAREALERRLAEDAPEDFIATLTTPLPSPTLDVGRGASRTPPGPPARVAS